MLDRMDARHVRNDPTEAHGDASIRHIGIDWRGRRVNVEVEWIGAAADTPLVVFLHEGLGSIAMWKDFPRRVCEALGCRALVYSRPGYGRSTPRAPEEFWDTDYLHRQAWEVLPALLEAIGVANRRYWLFGHSDGGSIALLHAARFPDRVAGAVVLAPHIMVEQMTLDGIAVTRDAYARSGLRARLARYHDDPDSAFWGWNRIWLDPRFRTWSIETDLANIRCPLLAVQGIDDPYGTLDQVRGIARRLPGTQVLAWENCGHVPHRDQPEALIAATRAFITGR